MNSKQKFRARIIFFLIILGSGVISASLYWHQIVKGEYYASRADEQYAKPEASLFDRGTIYFTSKDGMKTGAASISLGYLVYMNPSIVGDSEETYKALSNYLELDKADFIKRANKKNDLYEELAKKVSKDKATAISGLKIKGVGVVEETWRSYPGKTLASHSLGIVAESSSSGIEGRYGLEKRYEDILSRSTSKSAGNIFAELFGGIKGTVFGEEKPKGDIVTTLEPTVLSYLDKVLGETASLWKPDQIGGIVMNPKTGEIIAMSALPSFDANDLSDIRDISVLSNPMVEHVYEMGSILKPLTVAVGLDTGVITKKSTYNDTGTMMLSGKKISNFDGQARGVVGVEEILSQSLNVGAAVVALKIGKEDFSKYFLNFGFGEKTGIDVPNEATGIVNNLKTGRDIEIATASYGQGIALSPISMVRGLAVLANGGYLVTPHLVKAIEYTDLSKKNIKPEKSTRILEKKSVEEVTKMLVDVVDNSLKKGELKMDRYSVAAKTGTAQIPDPKNGGYYTDRYLHSFFGYFPAYDPEFIVFFFQVHPKGAQYASETLALPFSDMAKFLINYYNIPPDR